MTPEQLQTKIDIKHCKRCPLYNKSLGPVPYTIPRNPYEPAVAVQGEAPGVQEEEEGIPFIGPSGKLLRNSLGKFLDIDRLFLLNTICCLPDRKPPTPSIKELEACNDNLVRQLRAANPGFLLLLGSVAIKSYWPKLGLSDLRAKWWKIPYGPENKCWVFSTYHPAYILRRPDEMESWIEDLGMFSLVTLNMVKPEEADMGIFNRGQKAPTTGKLQGVQGELLGQEEGRSEDEGS